MKGMINAAIFGLGRWGRTLINSVQGKSDKIRFVTGIARTTSKHEDLAQEHELTLSDDYESVLGDDAIGAIVLATPPFNHCNEICAAAAAGKHVFVDKPFTLKASEAQQAVEACNAAGVVLAVGFNRRFYPSMIKLNELIGKGEIGEILHVEAQFCGFTAFKTPADSWRATREDNPGGGMVARGIHSLDSMINLCGEIESLTAASNRRVTDVASLGDDTTSAMFRFKSGATGYLTTIMATGDYWRFHVFGTGGWIELPDPKTLIQCDLDGVRKTESFDAFDIERAELEAFADTVISGTPYPVTHQQAIHGVKAHEAIVRAAGTGEPVSID